MIIVIKIFWVTMYIYNYSRQVAFESLCTASHYIRAEWEKSSNKRLVISLLISSVAALIFKNFVHCFIRNHHLCWTISVIATGTCLILYHFQQFFQLSQKRLAPLSEIGSENDKLIQHYNKHFNEIQNEWASFKKLIKADCENTDIHTIALQRKADEIYLNCHQLLLSVYDYGIEQQQSKEETPNPDEFPVETRELYFSLMTAVSNMAALDPTYDIIGNNECVLPGGIDNGENAKDNHCYIASSLQFLSRGYRHRFESLPSEHPLFFLKEYITRLAAGQTISREELTQLAHHFTSHRFVTHAGDVVQVGQQACAYELIGNILASLNVSQLGVHTGDRPSGEIIELGRIEQDAQGRLPFNLRSDLNTIFSVPIIPNAQDTLTLNSILHEYFNKNQSEMTQLINSNVEIIAEQTVRMGAFDDTLPAVLNIHIDRLTYQDISALDEQAIMRELNSSSLDKVRQEELQQQLSLLANNGTVKSTQPVQIKDLWVIPSQFMTDHCPVVYQLEGFLLHQGESSGHYSFFFPHQGKWYCANDNTISEIDEQEKERCKNLSTLYLFKKVL